MFSSSFLLSYILHPFHSLFYNAQKRIPIAEGLMAMSLVSLTLLVRWQVPMTDMFFVYFIFTLGSLAFYLYVQSTFLDFVAQLFRLRAQSLGLYNWYGLSILPYTLFIPLDLILSHFLHVHFVMTLFIFIYMGILQVVTIKKLYATNYKLSLFIYLFPILFVILFFVLAFFIIVGSMFFLSF